MSDLLTPEQRYTPSGYYEGKARNVWSSAGSLRCLEVMSGIYNSAAAGGLGLPSVFNFCFND